ncbi:MCE family protein [Rhodococcus globerulus]|uniref:MCE family protein n=1 Tax=Rhodococcus globerulus TaxID=33008 RepID=A0ABU4BQH3_RHOGO|nr:MCE family protein [Rhodococcus globerulus]MDV6266321.1 MCE family protein [Rhodococcus globerulus]
MDRLTTRTKMAYALRGAVAIAVAVVAAVAMVLRGSGNLERSTDVYVAIPADAGLISGEAPVRYHGVNIGRIGDIDSGTTESVVQLQIDTGEASKIPADVVARVVPRTFFGDIYMQLVDNPNAQSQTTLSQGDTIPMDTGPEAVALYDVYTELVSVLTAMRPEKMHTALTALGQALDGNGAEIGATIDNLSAASSVLTPAAYQFLDSTAEFTSVVDALDRATPDILDTLAAATSVSNSMVANQENLERSMSAAAVFAATLDNFVAENTGNIITVIDSTGKILATTAANPEGLRSTLANAGAFGAAGARVFSTGKFNITAVPTFADPLPYTGEDCPQYVDERGAQCSGTNLSSGTNLVPVTGGADEASALLFLEDQLLGNPPLDNTPLDNTAGDATAPNPATTLMLGPLVRGNEVSIP